VIRFIAALLIWGFAGPASALSPAQAQLLFAGTPPSGGAQSIAAVGLSGSSYTSGATSGTVIGAVSVTMSPASPTFTGTLSLTGTNAADFSLSSTTLPANLTTNGSTVACGTTSTYNINVVATQGGATGSPFTQAETITCNTGSIAYDSANSGAVSVGTITSGGTSTVTLPHAIPSGEAACIYIGSLGSSLISGFSITDTPGNTYTLTDSQYDSGAAPFGLTAFYVLNATGNPTSVVLHNSTGTTQAFAYFIIDLFSGVATSAALDGHNGQVQNNPGTGTDVISSGTFSPGTAGDLICGATVNTESQGTTVHGTGFTAGQSAVDGGTYWTEYKLSGVTGSQAVTFTDATNGTADAYVSMGMGLK
jgi:hypothetical protein